MYETAKDLLAVIGLCTVILVGIGIFVVRSADKPGAVNEFE